MKFKQVRRGYKREEVDGYISELVSRYEVNLRENKCTIDDLKEKLKKNEEELGRLKEKEKYIVDAMVGASEKMRETDNYIISKMRQENDRLKIFRSNWENYCLKIAQSVEKEKATININSYLDLADKELYAAIGEYFAVEDDCFDIKEELAKESARLVAGSYLPVYGAFSKKVS